MCGFYLQFVPVVVVKPAAVYLPVEVYPPLDHIPTMAATPKRIALRKKVKRLRADCERKRKTYKYLGSGYARQTLIADHALVVFV